MSPLGRRGGAALAARERGHECGSLGAHGAAVALLAPFPGGARVPRADSFLVPTARTRFLVPVAVLAATALLLCPLRAAEDEPKQPAVASGAVSPVEPADAVGTFQLHPGFRLELVAAEPLVRDPISIEFDEDGAAYVLELPTYNQHSKPGAEFRVAFPPR